MYKYKIRAYKAYYVEFVEELSSEESAVIRENLILLKEKRIFPQHYAKYLRDGLYEFRVSFRRNELRVFFFYDGKAVILLHGLKKKTQKLPPREIKKAIKLKEAYYAEKAAKGNQ